MRSFLFVLFLLCALAPETDAQSVFVPLNNSVYSFLSVLSAKNIIDYNDDVKPHSRSYVAEKLNEASLHLSGMTDIEKEELNFYSREFDLELRSLQKKEITRSMNYLQRDQAGRFRVFSYTDSVFSIFAEPVTGYDVTHRSSDQIIHGRNGAYLYGYFHKNIGFSLNFTDNTERGPFIDYTREFSPLTGYNFRNRKKNALDYDDVTASLTYSWKWGDVSLAKDYMQWGSGQSGQLILSDKAPSFPMIRLNVNPADWLYFTYIFGSLNSAAVDSGTIRVNTNKSRLHYELIPKYYVSHILTLKPFRTLSVSLGESVVYSDRIEPVYFIPFMFFRVADHYLNWTNSTAGNAQLFGNVSYNFTPLNMRAYGTVFIDEFSVVNVTDDKNYPTATAYTLGCSFYDPFIKDVTINAEYTRINPFVYFHSDDAQGYSSYNYQMGHWIGSNGDELSFSISKKFMRGLSLSLSYEYIRKGQKEVRTEPRYQKHQSFLWGLRTNYTFLGAALSYEITHNLNARIRYTRTDIERQGADMKYVSEGYTDINAGVAYGF